MGVLQLADMREEVRAFMGDRTSLAPNTRVDRALNLAQTRIARNHDYVEMRVLKTDTLPYTAVPLADKVLDLNTLLNVTSSVEEIREIYSLRMITGDGRARKMTQLSPRQFDKRFPEPEFLSTDIPLVFVRWKDQLEMYKPPDAAHKFELRYTRWPTAMAADGAVSELTHKDDLMMMLAASWLMDSYGQSERAKRFFGIFSALLKDAVTEDEEEMDLEIKPPVGEVPIGEYWTNPFIRKAPVG